MLKISSKIENYLSDKNMVENFYSIDYGKYIAQFGFIEDKSYIKILNYDNDDYLISEKKYLIQNRDCLKYIGFGANSLLKIIKSEKFEIIEENTYIYDMSEDEQSRAELVKKVSKYLNADGTNTIHTKEYKYLNGYLYVILEKYVNGNYDQYDKIYEYDYDRGETILTVSSLFEDRIDDIVVETHKVLNYQRRMFIIKTIYGTVSSIKETLPTTPITRRSYINFNLSVESLDGKVVYEINSIDETIKRIQFESIGVLGRPRHVKSYKIYHLSRELIEKMMREE